jgi:hypothetical protein
MGLLSRAARLTSAAVRTLMAVAATEQLNPGYGTSEQTADQIREAFGGNLTPPPITKTRWYMAQLEQAIEQADGGDLSSAAQLYRALRKDGVISGLLSTCTDGLVRLPKRFYGDPEQIRELEPRNGSRSVFDEMCPPGELALLAADGRVLGVGVAELRDVPGRDYPVLRRLDPQWLIYRWSENRWYYQSVAGLLPITPGDGRWVLHCPNGPSAPWQFGIWQALGRSWIVKEHAIQGRQNYSSKLANAARAVKSPAGATQENRAGFFQRVLAWGYSTVLELPPGYEVEIIESNGRGHEVFGSEITTSDNDNMIALAGQVVTTTGGTGFANANIHQAIRFDIIQSIADALAYTINTQVLPQWVIVHYGEGAIETRAQVEWDVAPPKERTAEATSLNTAAQALKAWQEVLASSGRSIDIAAYAQRFGVPIKGDSDGDGNPDQLEGEVISLHDKPTTDDPDGDGLEGEPPTPDAAQLLADEMTTAGVTACEHGAKNRCRLCGVERARGVTLDEAGQAVWKLAWKPIAAPAAQEAA